MKRLITLAAALGMLVLAVSAAAAPSSGPTVTYTCYTDSTRQNTCPGPPVVGETIFVSGCGFDAGQTVYVRWQPPASSPQGPSLSTVAVDSTGCFADPGVSATGYNLWVAGNYKAAVTVNKLNGPQYGKTTIYVSPA